MHQPGSRLELLEDVEPESLELVPLSSFDAGVAAACGFACGFAFGFDLSLAAAFTRMSGPSTASRSGSVNTGCGGKSNITPEPTIGESGVAMVPSLMSLPQSACIHFLGKSFALFNQKRAFTSARWISAESLTFSTGKLH